MGWGGVGGAGARPGRALGPGPIGPRALALCLYSLDWAVAVVAAVAVAAVAAVAMSMTKKPIAHYPIENIFGENALFGGHALSEIKRT